MTRDDIEEMLGRLEYLAAITEQGNGRPATAAERKSIYGKLISALTAETAAVKVSRRLDAFKPNVMLEDADAVIADMESKQSSAKRMLDHALDRLAKEEYSTVKYDIETAIKDLDSPSSKAASMSFEEFKETIFMAIRARSDSSNTPVLRALYERTTNHFAFASKMVEGGVSFEFWVPVEPKGGINISISNLPKTLLMHICSVIGFRMKTTSVSPSSSPSR